MSIQEDQNYSDKFEAEKKSFLKRQRVFSYVIAIPVLAGYFYFSKNPAVMEKFISPINSILIFAIIFLISWKFVPVLHCPRCKGNLGRNFNRGIQKLQRRCCGQCGLLLKPEIKLKDFRKSSFMKQEIRPGFMTGIIAFSIGLVLFGFYIDNESLKLGGVFAAGFCYFMKFFVPGPSCEGCGNMNQVHAKHCEYCGIDLKRV